MLTIPFKVFPAMSEEIILDDKSYRFRFSWNTRASFWSMEIFNSELETIVSGIKVVLNYELITRNPDRGLPPGEIFAIDPSDTLSEITLNNLGTEIKLIYVEESELV